MDLDAIEQRTNLTNRIRETIAKIDAKPWKRTDEERQQFEADAIMRAHVGPALDALIARVRELEESVRVHRESIARLDSIKSERGAKILELEEENTRLRGLEAASQTIRTERAHKDQQIIQRGQHIRELEEENTRLRDRVEKWERLQRLAADAARPDLTARARGIAKEDT